MHTPGSEAERERGGVGYAAKQVVDHVKTIVGLEIELAKLEVGKKIGSLGLGIGLLAGAAVVGVFGIAFLFATIAAALAEVMPTWLALLIVTAFLLLLTAILAIVGIKRVKHGSPPVPQQAIAEAKLTTEAFKGNGKR